ncbi:hypothetical protein [Clostridium sp.]|jgi:hypothetical protein|uniref:hypothetical protein n=1 Tax=Clostridium sp. TaxID=1506 RepID=UPI003EEF41B1
MNRNSLCFYIPKKVGNTTEDTVIKNAEITPPIIAQNIDFLKSNFRNAAIALPVHKPVVGRGIAINNTSAISLYFKNLEQFLCNFY